MLRIRMDAVLMSPISFERAWGPGAETGRAPRAEPQDFSLASESFEDGGVIPERLAREQGVSPQLSWVNPPQATERFVIIMDDPDAQQAMGHTFVHWVAAAPAGCRSLEEGTSGGGWTGQPKVLSGEYTSSAYRGPKPPSGTHRYCIAIYAMNRSFNDPEFRNLSGSALADDTRTHTREHFESVYRDDILASAVITGTCGARPQAAH